MDTEPLSPATFMDVRARNRTPLPRQTLATLVPVSESEPSGLKESRLHPAHF